LGQYEVEVSIFGVSEDDGIRVPILEEEAAELVDCIGEGFQRDGDVFANGGCPRWASGGDGRIQAAPGCPQMRGPIGAEEHRCKEGC